MSQQVCLPNITGYDFCVNTGPTICNPSSATIANFPGWALGFQLGYTSDQLPADGASYHTLEAGKTSIITVDIPAVGSLPGSNPSLFYFYSTPWINTSTPGDQYEQDLIEPVNDPPAGFIRFEIPVTFDRGAEKAQLDIFIKDQIGSNLEPWTSRIKIPFTVLGPISNSVEVLGTTVEPQMPYMVLHAPPGDGSSAEFVKEKTTCRALQTNLTETNSTAANLAVKLGVKGSLGFINTVDYEFSVTLKGGVATEDMVMRSTDEQTCITVNNSFMTSELTDNEGGGDIFIGYGTDLEYGIYDFINIDEANCTAFVDRGLIYAATGAAREFIYTKATILNEIEKNKLLMADTTNSVKIRNDAENQMDVWVQVLDLNLENINNPYDPEIPSLSFSGGIPINNSRTVSIVETNAINYENYIEGSFGVDVVVNVGGSGIAGGFEYKSAKRYGESQTQSEAEAVTIKYTLNDDEGGSDPDFFNMKIYQDPMFGTPIFKVEEGSRTSCPYQGGYQRDQPALKHDGVNGDHILLEGNPVSSSATFKLDLCNESDEERNYNLKLNAQSNLNGAVVSAAGVPLNGNDLGQSYTVPAQGCIEDLIVEVKMLSGNSPLEYPDLELFLYSECEESIQSSVFASVYFGDATGVEDLVSNISQLSIFPNPTSDMVNVNFNLLKSGNVKVELYDMLGRLQMQDWNEKLSVGEQQKQLDVSQMSPGVYMLVIQNGADRVTSKLVVEH